MRVVSAELVKKLREAGYTGETDLSSMLYWLGGQGWYPDIGYMPLVGYECALHAKDNEGYFYEIRSFIGWISYEETVAQAVLWCHA